MGSVLRGEVCGSRRLDSKDRSESSSRWWRWVHWPAAPTWKCERIEVEVSSTSPHVRDPSRAVRRRPGCISIYALRRGRPVTAQRQFAGRMIRFHPSAPGRCGSGLNTFYRSTACGGEAHVYTDDPPLPPIERHRRRSTGERLWPDRPDHFRAGHERGAERHQTEEAAAQSAKSRPIVTPTAMSRNPMISREKNTLKGSSFASNHDPGKWSLFP
jgi:hypothetical protein